LLNFCPSTSFSPHDLIHRYDNIDADEVWKTSDQDIPALLGNLEPLLPKKY
jgi:uncharacterized protein with HEPN domain